MTADDPASLSSEQIELLHPFYLDTDMSMAFAAALAGGVALEREEVERDRQESQAVRNLRGNLRLFGTFGIGGATAGASGEREVSESDLAATESRLVRHHTEASIFIALYDELQRTGRVVDASDIATLSIGEIVSFSIGPAVAPLRRVVDQLIRVLDVAAPLIGLGEIPSQAQEPSSATRQQRRQQARQAAQQAATTPADPGAAYLAQLRSLLIALEDDLDRSGMVDVVVRPQEGPSIILTLDKRFVSDQSLELLHTSRFTVIGKVTELWLSDTEVVNLFRRSVISLLPALGQTFTWGIFALLAQMARGLDPAAAQRLALAAVAGSAPDQADTTSPAEGSGDENDADSTGTTSEADEDDSGPADAPQAEEIMLGEDAINALNPAVTGPAVQVLPLAICA
jgi:hypothetical protein